MPESSEAYVDGNVPALNKTMSVFFTLQSCLILPHMSKIVYTAFMPKPAACTSSRVGSLQSLQKRPTASMYLPFTPWRSRP